MDDIELTYERAVELLKRAVKEKGADYKYEMVEVYDDYGVPEQQCVYIADGAPSCIAGHVFVWAGITIEEMSAHEGTSARCIEFPRLHVEPETIDLIDRAQANQDVGVPWGRAVQRAIEGKNIPSVGDPDYPLRGAS